MTTSPPPAHDAVPASTPPGDEPDADLEFDADADPDEAYGFAPAVDAGPRPQRPARRRRVRRGGLRHRLAGCAVLLSTLGVIGAIYAGFVDAAGGAPQTASAAGDVTAGRQLYQGSCITCHGQNLEGIRGQGVSLIGVGGAATYFQVSTGRMPLAQHGAYAAQHPPRFDEQQIEQLAAYIQSVGGGPTMPSGKLVAPSSQIGPGGALFRLNCAQCHGATGHGAPLSAGASVPSLYGANARQIWTAMLSGPENMPVFSNNEVTPSEKRQIVAYIQVLQRSQDPGGSGIGRVGPVSEAIVIWVAGVGLLMVMILWIGARSKT